jgi:hypothetical protein
MRDFFISGLHWLRMFDNEDGAIGLRILHFQQLFAHIVITRRATFVVFYQLGFAQCQGSRLSRCAWIIRARPLYFEYACMLTKHRSDA